jgi:hypothetical protein
MRVNSANVLDKGLRIGERGRRMNSKVKISQTRRGLSGVVLNCLNLNLSLAGLSWPLYIGGQVSRIQSISIQITLSVYYIISYFDYIYAWAYLTGLRGTKIMGFISYTFVSSPRDSTRIIDSGWISNLYIFDLINLRLLLFPVFIKTTHITLFLKGTLVNKPGISDGSGDQLTTGADNCYLLQTQAPGLESGT